MAELAGLPRWDMTPLFPSLESPELRAELTRLEREIEALPALFDTHAVRRLSPGAAESDLAAAFDAVTTQLNDLFRDLRAAGVYIHCFVATDASNDQAQSLDSELRTARITLDQLWTRYTAWLGTLDAEALLSRSAI